MSCPYLDCGRRSNNGFCQAHSKPAECDYGKRQLEVRQAFLDGKAAGIEAAKEAVVGMSVGTNVGGIATILAGMLREAKQAKVQPPEDIPLHGR